MTTPRNGGVDAVELALKLDKLVQRADCDDETRQRAIEFVWFHYCGHLIDWSMVRIPKEARHDL